LWLTWLFFATSIMVLFCSIIWLLCCISRSLNSWFCLTSSSIIFICISSDDEWWGWVGDGYETDSSGWFTIEHFFLCRDKLCRWLYVLPHMHSMPLCTLFSDDVNILSTFICLLVSLCRSNNHEELHNTLHFSQINLCTFFTLFLSTIVNINMLTKKVPKYSAKNKKKLASQIFFIFFGHETLIFHYAHKRSIFQKYFRISKNGHL
jgi:hypothetical protein